MARINIEEEAWSRIYRLAEMTDVTVREAAGTVACLWHRSQDLIKSSGTKEEILEWASLDKLSAEISEKWISGLKKSRFISEINNESFDIHGNQTQIENRISKFNRASKGGKALKKKLSELKKLKAGSKHSSGNLEAGSKGLKAIQSNSKQFKAKQSKAIQDNATQSNSTRIDVVATWNENCGKLPKVQKLTASRKKKIGALQKQYTDEEILQAVIKLANSDFCNGAGNTAWVADFDFFLQPDSISKTLEGKYDNRILKKTVESLFKNPDNVKWANTIEGDK